MMKIIKSLALIAFSVLVSCATNPSDLMPGQRELQLLRKNAHEREECFRDLNRDSVLRRTAFRLLINTEELSSSILEAGLTDSDPEIRQYAIYETFCRKGADALAALEAAIAEPDLPTARMVLDCAKNFPERTRSTELLKQIGEKSPHQEVRREAMRIVDFPFFRINKRLKDNPAYDHDIVTVKSISLPQDGWRFKVDPRINGHHKGFFQPEFKDANWAMQSVGAWENQGFPGYDGIAWYRIPFSMPEKIDFNAVELSFGAVDEVAWVWLNGVYIGQHDLGTKGWDLPFDLDVTNEIRWNDVNVLVVRVEDSCHAGGIWKPISVNILK